MSYKTASFIVWDQQLTFDKHMHDSRGAIMQLLWVGVSHHCYQCWCTTPWWATPKTLSEPYCTYVDPRAAQGLETPPRTSTSHLASDPKCRSPSAQPRTQLSMATCPGQRTMEATRGDGYAPVWGSLVMMMMRPIWCAAIPGRSVRCPSHSETYNSNIVEYL